MIRRLTAPADNRPFRLLGDPRQRAELLDDVQRVLIRRLGESEQEFTARVEYEADHMPLEWRAFTDLEKRQRERDVHRSDYDPIASVWSGR